MTRNVDGCIVATIGDLDEIAGHPPRPLDGPQRTRLHEWTANWATRPAEKYAAQKM